MKKSNKIAVSAATFVVLATIGGIALSAGIASSDTSQREKFGPFGGKYWSEEQKEEFIAKREERRAEREEKRAAVKTAIEANDYNAWIEAVGEDCPMAEKINEENFSRFIEANEKMEEARAIMEELGIERSGFEHFGQHKRGFMKNWR